MNNELNSTEIAELICTRLSHDVIGNIGAVANAVELLEEGDLDFMDDIKSILKTSSVTLSARLQFFRLAFGLDNSNLDKTDYVETTLRNYLLTIGNRNYPVNLEFNLQDSQYAKAVMLLAMVSADCFIRGGLVSIRSANGRAELTVKCEAAPSAEKWKQIKAALTGETAELNAQFAPVFYLLSWLKKNKIKLYVAEGEVPGFVLEKI